jgi:hypothetical protein
MKIRFLSSILLVFMLSSCLKKDISPAQLEGFKWKLNSITPEKNVLSTCQNDNNAVWEFKNGKLMQSPHSTCFDYFIGDYTLDGNTLIVDTAYKTNDKIQVSISGKKMRWVQHVKITGYEYDLYFNFTKQ